MLLIALVVGVLIYLLFFRNKKDESKKESGWIMSVGDKCKNEANISIVEVNGRPRFNCAGQGWDAAGFVIRDPK